MKPDPRLRKDGHCVQCRKERKPPKNYKYRAAWDADPFCSRGCCAEWHSVSYGKQTQPEREMAA